MESSSTMGKNHKVSFFEKEGSVKTNARKVNDLNDDGGSTFVHEIYRVERYFEVQGVIRRERLRAAVLCLEGEALAWYRWYEQQEPFESWDHLKEELLDRFQFTKEGDLYQQFLSIVQTRTLREYQSLFEKLAGKLTRIFEKVLYSTFIKGLKPEIRSGLRILQPTGLRDAMRPGHRCLSPTLHVLLVGENDEESMEEDMEVEDVDHAHLDVIDVSLNSVTGFTSNHTMKLHGIIGDMVVVVLIDSGATHNFMSTRVVKQLGIMVMDSSRLTVTLSNGQVAHSKGMCKGVIVSLPGMRLIEDFLPLELGSTDVILGIKWLQTLGDVNVNWKLLTMTFMGDHGKVTLVGDRGLCRSKVSFEAAARSLQMDGEGFWVGLHNLTTNETPGGTNIPKAVTGLLNDYGDVFTMPNTLTPNREHEHAIVLQDGVTSVSVRPYRYPQVQKDEIEKLVREMLEAGIIQPSEDSSKTEGNPTISEDDGTDSLREQGEDDWQPASENDLQNIQDTLDCCNLKPRMVVTRDDRACSKLSRCSYGPDLRCDHVMHLVVVQRLGSNYKSSGLEFHSTMILVLHLESNGLYGLLFGQRMTWDPGIRVIKILKQHLEDKAWGECGLGLSVSLDCETLLNPRLKVILLESTLW
ncbi:putative mitochondrial protein [Tanacetum coccineum]